VDTGKLQLEVQVQVEPRGGARRAIRANEKQFQDRNDSGKE
jgi:hypothetical protein